jgi:Predicted transcriptional regulator with C-terminal CBS domains
VGELIREARESRNLTQEALARMIGVTAPYVTQIESGRRVPTVTTCLAISDALPDSFRVDALANDILRLREPKALERLEFRLRVKGKARQRSQLEILESRFRLLAPKDQEVLVRGWHEQIKVMIKERARPSERDRG